MVIREEGDLPVIPVDITADVARVVGDLGIKALRFAGKTILVTGGCGFIGAYFVNFFHFLNQHTLRTPCRIICVDNFCTGALQRVAHLTGQPDFTFVQADICQPLKLPGDIQMIIHTAGIASPSCYRRYPLETIDVNVQGLRHLLEFAREHPVESFLHLSSSEVYGDPDPDNIPTPETYRGNVSCTGPRACYDESKRLGETLCLTYHSLFGIPVKVVRPFNIYGPGLRPDDRRVIPDLLFRALTRQKMVLFSDGTPTRSFCYISDALTGFLLTLLSLYNGEVFNIGNDREEVSMRQLAETIRQVAGIQAAISYQASEDPHYLQDNPIRRCPELTKAKRLLGYRPRVPLEAGLTKMVELYRQ